MKYLIYLVFLGCSESRISYLGDYKGSVLITCKHCDSVPHGGGSGEVSDPKFPPDFKGFPIRADQISKTVTLALPPKGIKFDSVPPTNYVKGGLNINYARDPSPTIEWKSWPKGTVYFKNNAKVGDTVIGNGLMLIYNADSSVTITTCKCGLGDPVFSSDTAYYLTPWDCMDCPSIPSYRMDTITVIGRVSDLYKRPKHHWLVDSTTGTIIRDFTDTVKWTPYYTPYDTVKCLMLCSENNAVWTVPGYEVLTYGVHVKYLGINKNKINYIVWSSKQIK